MKIKTGRDKLDAFIRQADCDKDPYLLVHFSRCEDKYMGYNCHMDIGDALIVINHLCEQFGIERKALSNDLYEADPLNLWYKEDEKEPPFPIEEI